MENSSSLETLASTQNTQDKDEEAATVNLLNQLDEILESNNVTQEYEEEEDLRLENEEEEILNFTEPRHENPPTEIQQINATSTFVPPNVGFNDGTNSTPNGSFIANLLLSHYSQLLAIFQPTEEQLTAALLPTPPTPLSASTVVLISTPELLMKLVGELQSCKEIGVHLFYEDGYCRELVTVMTISTKTHDFFIDVEQLDASIAYLSEIFLNPNIVKVVLSCERFIDSLKYSMHMLCVNVFDVQEACIVRGASKFLFFDRLNELYRICRVPKRMNAGVLYTGTPKQLDVHRSISHYLIFFYEECKCALNATAPELLKSIYEKGNAQCKQLIRPDARPVCYQTYLNFLKAKQQCELELFESTFAWREDTANNTKVNRSRVMSGHEFLAIVCNLPTSHPELVVVAPEFCADKRKASNYFNTVLQPPGQDLKQKIDFYRDKVPVNLSGDTVQLVRQHPMHLGQHHGHGKKKNKSKGHKGNNNNRLQGCTFKHGHMKKVNLPVKQPIKPRKNPWRNAEVHTEPSQSAASADSVMNSVENIVQNETHTSIDSAENIVQNETHKSRNFAENVHNETHNNISNNNSAENKLELEASKPKRRRRRLQYNATNGNDSE